MLGWGGLLGVGVSKETLTNRTGFGATIVASLSQHSFDHSHHSTSKPLPYPSTPTSPPPPRPALTPPPLSHHKRGSTPHRPMPPAVARPLHLQTRRAHCRRPRDARCRNLRPHDASAHTHTTAHTYTRGTRTLIRRAHASFHRPVLQPGGVQPFRPRSMQGTFPARVRRTPLFSPVA